MPPGFRRNDVRHGDVHDPSPSPAPARWSPAIECKFCGFQNEFSGMLSTSSKKNHRWRRVGCPGRGVIVKFRRRRERRTFHRSRHRIAAPHPLYLRLHPPRRLGQHLLSHHERDGPGQPQGGHEGQGGFQGKGGDGGKHPAHPAFRDHRMRTDPPGRGGMPETSRGRSARHMGAAAKRRRRGDEREIA